MGWLADLAAQANALVDKRMQGEKKAARAPAGRQRNRDEHEEAAVLDPRPLQQRSHCIHVVDCLADISRPQFRQTFNRFCKRLAVGR